MEIKIAKLEIKVTHPWLTAVGLASLIANLVMVYLMMNG